MKFTILTLFPEMFAPLQHSIIKRACVAGKIQIEYVNFRDYTTDKHKRVDDAPFGGGAGLVLTAQPIVDCIDAVDPRDKVAGRSRRIFLTPTAPVLTQARVRDLAKYDHLVLLCGHYEGVDQRAVDLSIDECISIGEYVLTGGEIPAMVVVDAVARHVDGVIKKESAENESFSNIAVHGEHRGGHGGERPMKEIDWEHPQYTRPRDFRGMVVPEVLLNGNHADIKKWQDGSIPSAPANGNATTKRGVK